MARPKRFPTSKAKWQRVPVGVPLSITELAELVGVSSKLIGMKVLEGSRRTPIPFPYEVTWREGTRKKRIITRLAHPDAPDPELQEEELDWTK